MTDNELLKAMSDMMQAQLEPLRNDMQELKSKVDNIDERVSSVESKVDSIDRKVTSVELTLENETNPNIKAIAEGHLDLSRKLDDALKVENEKEMLLIRVTVLENELRKVKESIAQLA